MSCLFFFSRDENQYENDGMFPGRQRGDYWNGPEEADERLADRRVGIGADRQRHAAPQRGPVVPGQERDGAHRVRDAGDGRGQVDYRDAHPPDSPVGETGTIADPARQSGVRQTSARQRHAAHGGRHGGRRTASAHRARGRSAAHREERTVRATNRRRHRRGGRRGRLVLRRRGQPVAGPPGVHASAHGGRRPGVPLRPRLAAEPSAARVAVVVFCRLPGPVHRRTTTGRRHTLVPAHAVRHIRLRDTVRVDGHALNATDFS